MFCRKNAIKVIDFCLQSFEEGCEVFVQRLGLKTLFAAFMKKVCLNFFHFNILIDFDDHRFNLNLF
jgi:hypothetical protein